MGAGEPPVIADGQPLWVRIRGWMFCAFTLISALFGSIYIITPLIPLLFLSPRCWRKCMDRLAGIWVVMPGSLMTYIFGAKVRVRGDMIDHSKPAVIIMNHRSRLDWLYFWNALYTMDPWLCTSEKITLKAILKYLPGAGWAMACNAYIFLDRTFRTDRTRLDKIIEYYSRCGYNYQILLYPEGTDKCPLATERSRKYAEKNNLVHYEYVLHPRTTGFVHMIQNMRKETLMALTKARPPKRKPKKEEIIQQSREENKERKRNVLVLYGAIAGYIDYVYDVTIGFGDCIVQSEVDFFLHGVCPKDVHYQVRKLDINDLPLDDTGLSTWLIDLWKEKEEKLRRFYSFHPKQREFENTPGGKDYTMNKITFAGEVIITLFWFVITAFWLYGFLAVPYMFSFSIVSCSIFVFIQRQWGGVEWLTIEWFNYSEKLKQQ